MLRYYLLLVIFFVKVIEIEGYHIKSINRYRLLLKTNSFKLFNSNDDDDSTKQEKMELEVERDNKVIVGSKEYYKGFLETDLSDDRSSDGLEQTLKLAGSASGILAVLFFLFLKSNNLV